jgi:hypothetical protein
MKIKQLGACVRVTVSAAEVSAFCEGFPGAELGERSIAFFLDAQTGDLEEIYPCKLKDAVGILELSEDAKQAYEKWRSREDIHRT